MCYELVAPTRLNVEKCRKSAMKRGKSTHGEPNGQAMDEVEKYFKCPYCFEKISMLLDISVDGQQTYVEDCEVCCNPIQIVYLCKSMRISSFEPMKA